MPDIATILSLLQARLSQQFGLDDRTLEPDEGLADLGVDSLHLFEILLDLEAELGFRVDNLALPPNPTLKQVAQAISGEQVIAT